MRRIFDRGLPRGLGRPRGPAAERPTVPRGAPRTGGHRAGLGARLACHAIQPIELLVDPLREGERIGLRQHPAQGCDFLRIGLRARAHPLKRRLRSVIATDPSRALPDFAQEFHRRLEQGLEQPQVGIQRVEGLQRLRTVVAIPADELAHMGPVLLLPDVPHTRVCLRTDGADTIRSSSALAQFRAPPPLSACAEGRKERRLPQRFSEAELKRFFRAIQDCGDVPHEILLTRLFSTAVRVSVHIE